MRSLHGGDAKVSKRTRQREVWLWFALHPIDALWGLGGSKQFPLDWMVQRCGAQQGQSVA